MPFCDVMELFDYWRDYPPLHWLVRGAVGYEPPKPIADDPMMAMRVLNPRAHGARKIANAPEHVRRMAESVRESMKQ